MNPKSEQLKSFCERWLEKAEAYDDFSLSGCFDKFTALYILYNTVYTEAGFFIRRSRTQGLTKVLPSILTRNRKLREFEPLPDRLSATEYIVDYYGKTRLQQEIRNDVRCSQAINDLVSLISSRKFYFHTDYDNGSPNYAKDLRLAQEAQQYAPKAILSLVYQARCNLFHGGKDYTERQQEILMCLSTLLEFITQKVLNQLLQDLKKQENNY